MVLVIQAEKQAAQNVLKLVQEDVSNHKVRVAKDDMSTLQRIQSLHPFQLVAKSEEDDNSNNVASLAKGGCHLTSSGILDIYDSAATVMHEGENHHYISQRKRQHGSQQRNPHYPRASASHLWRQRRESVAQDGKHGFSRKDQVFITRQRNDHHADLKYWLHKIGWALDAVRRKCGVGRRQISTQWGCVLHSNTLHHSYHYLT